MVLLMSRDSRSYGISASLSGSRTGRSSSRQASLKVVVGWIFCML